MRILVAIPTFNEVGYVPKVLKQTRRYQRDILFIDDGSSDGTGQWLEANASPAEGIHVLRHGQNQGYGRSLIDAFNFAGDEEFDWVITMDCDEQHEPRMIPAFTRAIKTSRWDLISGSRYHPRSTGDAVPPEHRRQINVQLTQEVNNTFGWRLTDTFCGFKAHRVAPTLAMNLDETGYAFPMQLWPRAFDQKLRICELPVSLIYKDYGRTFGNGLDDHDRRLRHYREVFAAELARIDPARLVKVQSGVYEDEAPPAPACAEPPACAGPVACRCG
ncbi:MAG: glycosyltransferase family 2 protein [Phycisphaerae bacterium]